MNTSEILEAWNKIGSREEKEKNKEGEGGGLVFLGIPYMADKQAETRVQRHRITSGQWGGLCSGCKVVWETLGPGWEVFSRERSREREKERENERHSHFISLLGRVTQYSTMSFSPRVQRE